MSQYKMTSKAVMINIRGKTDIDDDNYRYKMEEVNIIQQGALFAFTNINSICKSLNRDTTHMLKFLKKHMGLLITYKNDSAQITKKDLTKNELQQAIFKYIEDNILCEKCKNPETDIAKDKKKDYIVCKACSHKTLQ